MHSLFNSKTFKELKTFVLENKASNPIFSYDLKLDQGRNLILQQKETGCSLSLQIEQRQEELIIKSFTIVDNKQLEALSLALYDASLIEISLRALDFLFFFADHQGVEEMKFVLIKEEAEHLSSFKSFFQSITHQNICVFMTLPTSLKDYDEFIKQTEVIHTKIRRALWQLQKEDYLLRSYLQGTQKEGGFSLNISRPETQPIAFEENVIAFPNRAKNISIEKAL